MRARTFLSKIKALALQRRFESDSQRVTEPFAINNAQFQKILAAIDALYDHTPYWMHLLVTAFPIFLASLLGFVTALFLDWLKTRRDSQKLTRERREKELAQLSGVTTAIGFNIEALIHTVMQQVLPHRDQSYAAIAAIQSVRNKEMEMQQFYELLHSEFLPIVTRCPEPYFIQVDLFKEIPFVLAKDPELLKLSGWVLTFTRHLLYIFDERNKHIDLATLGKDDLDIKSLERHIATQATVGDKEVVNCFQLFQQFIAIGNKLEAIIRQDYKDVIGPKLRVQPPDVLKDILKELERLAKEIVPEWPPPEPPAS